MNITFEQGWAARPFKEQFPQLSDNAAGHLDRVNAAITDLYLSEVITHSAMENARQKKFPKLVAKALAEAHAETVSP